MRGRLPRTTTYDLPLLVVVLALLLLGLAMVYSASGITALDANDDPGTYLAQQSAWAALGLAAMFVAARLDYRRLRLFAAPLLVVSAVLLVAVLIPGVGVRVGGATRWLRIAPIIGLQPAELAKLAVILYLGTWLGAHRDRVGSWRVSVPFLVVTATVAGLVVAEPDLGTAIVIVAVALAMYFAAGARLREFAAVGGLAVIVGLALAVVQPYRYERLLTFVDPWSNPRGTGFQTIQMLYGLALGGPFGEGLGAGKEKFGFLPAPYTDSIFAVLGDELGLVGTATVILLFLVLAFRGVRIALRAQDSTGGTLRRNRGGRVQRSLRTATQRVPRPASTPALISKMTMLACGACRRICARDPYEGRGAEGRTGAGGRFGPIPTSTSLFGHGSFRKLG